MRKLVLALALSTSLSACASARLPMCPKVAIESYPVGQTAPSYINHYVSEAAAAREIRLTPLSSFALRARGSTWDIGWLRKNYRELLCAFETRRVPDDQGVYMACMAKASTWMEIVASEHPEVLMADQYGFNAACTLTSMTSTVASLAGRSPDPAKPVR